MSTLPILETLEQARGYAARAACDGCEKNGTLSVHLVQKEGPNQGRLFAKCRHCGHFAWLSPALSADQELEQAEEAAPPCPRCGKGRSARRVRKEGPNHGRVFLVCHDPACDSFQWVTPAGTPRPPVDDVPQPTQGQRTEEGLLADIRHNPEDEPLHLIYADWLEEHDQPHRAELIRLQVQRERFAPHESGWREWHKRAQAVLREHEEDWTAGLRPHALSYEFRRGLIDEVEVTAEGFAGNADALLAAAPTAAWHIHVAGWPGVKTLVRSKALLRVRRLVLLGERMGGAGARVLAESFTIANLRWLALPGQSLGQPGVQALAGSRYLANLEVLDLTENNLSRSAVPILASSSNLPRLRRLVLADNLLGDSDVRALVHSSHLKELRELDLSGNSVSNEGAEVLADSPLLSRLRWLNLSGCRVTRRGLSLLCGSPRASAELVIVG